MNQAFICAVSPKLPENYEIGVLVGKWGVEDAHHARIVAVKPGDLLIFIVGGHFRSIHRIASPAYIDETLLWPPKNGDVFRHRVNIGPPEVAGSVPVRELAPSISFMRGKVWGGTIQGPNGVFNPRLTYQDVELIRLALLTTARTTEMPKEAESRIVHPIAALPTESWGPGLLDQLAALAHLTRTTRFPDPFAGEERWSHGLLTGVYADAEKVPTVAVAPLDRQPDDAVLSTLYGLSALRQAAPIREVRGVIFTHRDTAAIAQLTRGIPNLSTYGFDVHVSLRP